jgi:hypothetical protein
MTVLLRQIDQKTKRKPNKQNLGCQMVVRACARAWEGL